MRINPRIPLAAGAFLFAAAFPVAFKYGYHADVPLWLIFGLVGLKSGLFAVAEGADGTRKYVWTGLSWLVTLIYAVLVIVSVLITPYSSYRFWLENVKTSEAEGTVSNLLVVLVGLVATMSSGLIHRGKAHWAALTMAIVVSSLLAFVYQTDAALLLVIGSLAVFIGTLAWTSGYRGSRGRSFLQLGSLFGVCLLLAAMFTGSGAPTGSRLVDLQLYPWLREEVLAAFPRFPLLYAIPGYGYSFNETKKLGGTPVLSEAGIFSVEMPDKDRLYLRTRAYDTYDGKSWQLSSEGEESGPGLQIFQSSQARSGEVGIKLLAEYYSMIPHTLDTEQVRFEAPPPAIQSGNRNIGVLLAKPIKRGTVMYLERTDRPQVRRPRTLRPYLQVPPDVPESVRFLAQQLAANTSDPRLILKRIEQYLALNYTYSLETEEEGGYSGDFVTDFLFGELQGYCVHFATSFALLARLDGIPVRYVTGFLVVPSDKPGPTEVTGLNAHAWPEVWLDDNGWTIYEATPALNPVNWEFIEDNWLYNLSLGQNNLTSQQLRQVLGSRVPPKVKPPEGEFVFPTWWVVGGAAALALLALLVLAALRFLELMRVDREGFLFRLRSMVRALKRRGVAEPAIIGWVEWGNSVEKRFGVDGAARRAVNLITETVYGHRIPGRRDIIFMRRLRRRLAAGRAASKSSAGARPGAATTPGAPRP
jgi:hypothetical protein